MPAGSGGRGAHRQQGGQHGDVRAHQQQLGSTDDVEIELVVAVVALGSLGAVPHV
jgi:hypothetical protein